MFCLDYILAFASHFAIAALTVDRSESLPLQWAIPAGGAAGLAAAIALYPVDIVRMSSVPAGQSWFAFSTIPFMTVYLGGYFGLQGTAEERRLTPLAKKCGIALGATSCAALAELPFDRAKIAMSGGGLRRAAIANGLRVPLGAGLLVAYDQIFSSEKVSENVNALLRKW